ncbi:cupin domain-containing protein [Roseovarius sp. LXJ103]|uniref:cupin domain-containing protein n=1 Tax=Roseovarius carneus TaxID=2853164 RepID=UPI000D60858A|nr:cupin domain-containing protein [Roseovarius carneus]MBZ8118146.1 cupin domain-containing protein [Roseovarius carneus]PWE36122.1 cupin [Pelagicola sp. LXJ1103]
MKINADFSKRAVVRPEDYAWAPSPAAGVERMMLDRVGDEVARATSLVRFAPGSRFDAHSHGGGEEFLVLEGVFSDETGDFPAGSYVRNPIGTSHTPHTDPGCTILVKLHQFAEDDTAHFSVDTKTAAFRPGMVDGLSVLPLHTASNENVALVRWAPGTRFTPHQHRGGEEVFVLEGIFQDEHGSYPAGSWIRSPHLSTHAPWSDAGCLIYVKTGHLAFAAA